MKKGMLDKVWVVGYRDRGMGHGDYAVMTRLNDMVTECPSMQVASHIINLHNDYLASRKREMKGARKS